MDELGQEHQGLPADVMSAIPQSVSQTNQPTDRPTSAATRLDDEPDADEEDSGPVEPLQPLPQDADGEEACSAVEFQSEDSCRPQHPSTVPV